MTRQEKIKFLGKHTPSEFNGNRNFLSYFIIPVPHKVYDFKNVDKFLEIVKKSNWIINYKINKKTNKLVCNGKRSKKKQKV